MTFLLDTHAFLWFAAGDKQLPESIKTKIMDIKQACFISAASLWEITIKHQLGKLELDISLQELFDFLDRNQIEILPITNNHLITLSELPHHHNDPFDRLIISQAITEELTITTKDKMFKKYKVKHHWK